MQPVFVIQKMEKFALKMDLTAFFNNIYEKVVILADAKWENVAKVEKKIKRMFNIDCDIALKSEEGYYIPSEEPIEILKHVMFVIVIKRSAENGLENVEPIPTTDFVAKKKRSRRVLNDHSFTTSTPAANFAKKLKGLDVVVPNTTCGSDVSPISKDVLERNSRAAEKSENKSKTKNSIKGTEEISNQEKNNASLVSHHSEMERVSKSVFPTSNKDSANISKASSNDNAESKAKSGAHIFFDDSGEEGNSDANSQPKIQKQEILLVCNLESARNKKGRIFRIGAIAKSGLENNEKPNGNGVENQSQTVKEISMSIEDVSQEHQENNLAKSSERVRSKNETSIEDVSVENHEISLAKCRQPLTSKKDTESGLEEFTQSDDYIESLISCDESAITESEMGNISVDCTQESVNVSSKSISADLNEYCVEKMLPKSSELTNPPGVGDFVIFKIKLANGKMSDFFVGRCEYINKRTKTLKFELTGELSKLFFK